MFSSKFNYNSGSLTNRHFGVAAEYELQKERIPFSNCDYISQLQVQVIGTITGGKNAEDYFGGDQWSKMWMHTRQTLFQHVFAQPGTDNKVKIAENHEIRQLIEKAYLSSHNMIFSEPSIHITNQQKTHDVSWWKCHVFSFEV